MAVRGAAPSVDAAQAAPAPGLTPAPSDASAADGAVPTFDAPGDLPPIPQVPTAKRQLIVGGGVAGAALLLGVALFLVIGGTDVRLPDQIGGAQRVQNEQVQAFERFVADVAGAGEVKTHVGVYADPVGQMVFLIVGEDDSPITAEQALRAFTVGVEATDPQTTVRLTRLRTESRGEVPFACAPIRGSIEGGLCAWKDTKTVGFVLAPGQVVGDVMDLTAESYAAVRA